MKSWKCSFYESRTQGWGGTWIKGPICIKVDFHVVFDHKAGL